MPAKRPNMFKAISNHSFRVQLSTAKNLRHQYGMKGLFKATKNKLNDRSLLDGLESTQQTDPISPVVASHDPSIQRQNDEIGKQILREQQEEFTQEDYAEKIKALDYKPLISVIMPVYEVPLKWLQAAIASLKSQYYPYWELCVVDDGSKDKRIVSLLQKLSAGEPRIHFYASTENRGISAASNTALEMASGEYIALMDDDDAIPPDALYWVAHAIDREPDADFLYTDECRIGDSGKDIFSHFFFKPNWSPEMMINFMYTGHLSTYKKELIYAVGSFRSEYNFSQDYDLALRASQQAKKIVHLERILYFWRMIPTSAAAGAKNDSVISNTQALTDYFRRMNYDIKVLTAEIGRYLHSKSSTNPKVSIIIPTDNMDHVHVTIKALARDTSYSNYELVFVVNSAVLEEIEQCYPHYSDWILTCRYDGVFNFSDKCNIGAKAASGEVLIFYNDDAWPYRKDWIEQLLCLLFIPGVGGVSPAMLYTDAKSVQYGGTQVGQHICGLFGPSFHRQDFCDTNRIVNPQLIRDVTALSGACMAVRKDIFFDVGGFDSIHTPNGHSDVDFSFRLAEHGYRCVYTPYSALIHPGNGTWTLLGLKDKANLYVLKKWHARLRSDAYFSRSMRRYHLGMIDLPYDMFFPDHFESDKATKGDLLLVCHELSRSGAPVVFLEAARLLKEAGYFVILAAPFDGPVRNDFLQNGIPVIIDETLAAYRWHSPAAVPDLISHSIKGIINEFDLVICITMVCHNIVNCYNRTNTPILWWLHEGWYSYKDNAHFMPDKLGSNVSVYCGGLYAQQMLSKYKPHYTSDVLLYGVKDRVGEHTKSTPPKDKIRFIFPGSYEARKNQRLLLDAIKSLPADVMDHTDFIMIGTVFDVSPDSISIFNDMKAAEETIDNLRVMQPIPYDELMALYETADCIVVPSIDDPMPVVLTEALMLSKIVLCSNQTGTSRYIQDGINGYVFKSGSKHTLQDKICHIVRHQDEMDEIRKAGRRLYEEIFTSEAFRTHLLDAVEKHIKRF